MIRRLHSLALACSLLLCCGCREAEPEPEGPEVVPTPTVEETYESVEFQAIATVDAFVDTLGLVVDQASATEQLPALDHLIEEMRGLREKLAGLEPPPAHELNLTRKELLDATTQKFAATYGRLKEDLPTLQIVGSRIQAMTRLRIK